MKISLPPQTFETLPFFWLFFPSLLLSLLLLFLTAKLPTSNLVFILAFYSQENRKHPTAIPEVTWTREKHMIVGAVTIDKCWRWQMLGCIHCQKIAG